MLLLSIRAPRRARPVRLTPTRLILRAAIIVLAVIDAIRWLSVPPAL